MMQAYYICHREVWFISRQLRLDTNNKHIVKGEMVDQNTYKENSERIRLGPIAPDMLEDGKIVEVKPSKKLEKASKMQLAYYLWYINEKYGEEKEGVLAYPKQRTREHIQLTEDLINEVESAIKGIYNITTKDNPPEIDKKPYCENCAYQDICWINNGQ